MAPSDRIPRVPPVKAFQKNLAARVEELVAAKSA